MKIRTILKKIANKIDPSKKITHTEKTGEEMIFAKKHQWLRKFDITKVIDIGANEGQLAKKYRALFPEAQIISFEPLTNVYKALLLNFQNDQKFKAFNFALGEKEESATIFLNEYSPSSSLLQLGDEHKNNFSFAKKETPVNIQIRTLDSFDLVENGDNTLIKIDVQGFEKFVINGGLKTISSAKVVILETSFKQLYIDEPLFDVIYQQMTSLGFKFSGVLDQLLSPISGEVLQGDAIFVKDNN